MSETITAKDYREMAKSPRPAIVGSNHTHPIGLTATMTTRGIVKVGFKPDTKQLLRMMGDYFELDKKAVNFWIRQMELDKKI